MTQSTSTRSLVGALTSKPFAFVARPWELVVVPSADIYDSFLGSVRLDFRGSELLRVLPLINEDLNEEWLTDKARFSYDGLKKQRLLHPYVNLRSAVGMDSGFSEKGLLQTALSGHGNNATRRLKRTSYNEFRALFTDRLNSAKKNSVDVFFGKECDIETALSLDVPLRSTFKEVVYRNAESFNFSSFEGHCLPKLKIDQRALLGSEVLVLVGCNLRWESPLLNVKILRSVSSDFLSKVYTVACRPILNYDATNIGSNVTTFTKNFLTGRSPLARALLSTGSNSYFLFGYSSSRLALPFSALLEKRSSLNFKQGILFPWASTLGLLETLPASEKRRSFAEPSVSLSLGSDAMPAVGDRHLSLGLFSHGHDSQKSLDFLYPSPGYGELYSHFLNLFGIQRYTRFGFTTNTHILPPWAAVSDLFLPLALGRRYLMSSLSSQKLIFNTVCPTSFDEDHEPALFYRAHYHGSSFSLLNNFYEVVPAYYRTHFAIRASKPMSLASARFAASSKGFSV